MIVRLYDVTGKKIYRGDQQIMIPLENDICILKGFIYKVKLRTWLFETSTRSKNICHLLVEEVGTETGGLYKEKETANNSDQPETVNVIKQLDVAPKPLNVNQIPPTDHQIDMICGHRLTPDEYEIFRKGFNWYMESNKIS